MTISFCVFILLSSFLTYYAFTAPRSASELPDGWCDLRYGRPTRTTNECMCLGNNICVGPSCSKGQGFIWYSYRECPTCKCAPSYQPQESDQTHKSIDLTKERISDGIADEMVYVPIKKIKTEVVDSYEEDPLSVLDLLNDYWRHLFAAFMFSLVILVAVAACYTLPVADAKIETEDDTANENSSSGTFDKAK